MPSYDYECENCGFKFRVSHSIMEKKTDCVECESVDTLVRYSQSQNVTTFVDKTRNKEVGSVVKESIEEFRRELDQQRAEASNRSYDG